MGNRKTDSCDSFSDTSKIDFILNERTGSSGYRRFGGAGQIYELRKAKSA